jgi:hypothetical protein
MNEHIPLIIIHRFWANPDKATLGRVYVDAKEICYSLEDPVREVFGHPVSSWKIKGKTAIPVGTYKVILSHSPRFKKELPEVLGVLGFSKIRIHGGNDEGDTEGCILVAEKRISDERIQGSKSDFFVDLLRKSGGKAILRVEGSPNPNTFEARK